MKIPASKDSMPKIATEVTISQVPSLISGWLSSPKKTLQNTRSKYITVITAPIIKTAVIQGCPDSREPSMTILEKKPPNGGMPITEKAHKANATQVTGNLLAKPLVDEYLSYE